MGLIDDHIRTHPYIIKLTFIRPSTGLYSINEFRLQNETDINSIKKRYFQQNDRLTITRFEGSTNACLHVANINNIRVINNFVFRGVTIQGNGVIFGMNENGEILQGPSERPCNHWNIRGSKRENIVLMNFNDFKASRADILQSGDDEVRKMDRETNGSWRIENDLD